MMDTEIEFVEASHAATWTITVLNALIVRWQSSPEQLHHLRDDVERFQGLLLSVSQSEEALQLLNDRHDAALMQEIGLAKRSLESIQTIIRELHPREDSNQEVATEASRSGEAKLRHRWVLRREDITRTQRSLQLSCHHILSRLVVRALYVQ